MRRRCHWQGQIAVIAVVVFLLLTDLRAAPAEEFDGVQPAALDQPRVNVLIRRSAHGPALAGKTEVGVASNVEAFLDTGASGLLLSEHTASLLGIARERGVHDEVRFLDIGVGGGDTFAVSEKLCFALAASDADVDVAPEMFDNVYVQHYVPWRAEVGPLGGGMMDVLARELMGDLDVVGMPTMIGKVVVMDAAAVNNVSDKMRTTIYDARHDSVALIPKTRRHVRLSFANFAAFTTTTPATAEPPEMVANPFIGPTVDIRLDQTSTAKTAHDSIPPITIEQNGKRSTGSWLLDTGAAASMLSRQQAAVLGVTYDAPSEATDAPKLIGVMPNQQFTMTVGGIGGSKKAAGFFIDRLTVQTVEGTPITYLHAPVLVSDITVKDPHTGKSLTLDGVFGMNFLVASAKLTEGILPDIDHITPGPYRWIVFDQPKGLLGLD